MIFEVDIFDFLEMLIGDLLYITDYLSININKNELLIKSYNETERELLTFKLNKIKEIVNIIFELLLSNIKSDYNNEMSINNNESIKYNSEIKSKKFLDETEKRSNEIIKIIKTKISYMDLYEIYCENLNFINYIQNKSIIEFIEDSYNHIVKSVLKLEPEYLNKTSDMMIKKENLFSISKLIIKEINDEINGISLYIKNFIDKFKEQNIYYIYYNLYKINGMFFENEIKFLLDELKRLIYETISMHIKKLDANYKLGFDYLNDLKYEILNVHRGETTFVGKGLFDKYMKFIEYFNQFVSSIISDNSDIFINLENNYYKIKNDIFNVLKNKLLTINKYGFETNIYKENFYFINQMNSKLLSIFDKINHFFSEERFLVFKNEILLLFMSQIKEYNEKKLTEFMDLYEYIFKYTKGIYNTEKDYEYQFRNFWRKLKVRTCWLGKTTNNINNIDISISQAIDYVNNNIPNIIKSFQTKVDQYLSNYIFNIQNIYTSINSFLQEKIKNNNNINILLNNYRNTFNLILNNDSNFGLLKKILLLDLNKNVHFCNDNLENNLKLIYQNYYMNYYLKNYTSFLEFPEEIQYKINNFGNIIKIIINEIKQNINSLYRNRIINSIKSTNNYIINMLSSHKRYIVIYLNKNDVVNEYLQSKINFITNSFNEFSTQINKLSKDFMQNNNLKIDDLILSYDNYNLPISSIFMNINLFQEEFNSSVNKNFKEENCLEIYESYNPNSDFMEVNVSDFLENNDNESESKNIFCEIAMNKSSFKNYEYNYNIVKLRSGLNYTKNIIENIINMIDEFKYDEMLNILKFNDNEYLINDNNILFIENATLHNLNEINVNSFPILDEQNEIIKEDILKKYNLNNDYYIFLKEFKKLLNFENEKIKMNINNYITDRIHSINLLFNKFNNTLYGQKNKYEYYTIKNINIFKEFLMNYYNMIENKFSIKYSELINLENTVHFKNIIRNYLSDLQNKKRIYFKTRINELGKKYNLHSLNITLNIGEYFEKYIERCYEDLELDYIFEYVGIYENYSKIYIDNLVNYFKDYKNIALNKFSIIINEFLQNFQNGISNFVNNNYITELKRNYSSCFGYSIDLLNQTIKEDKSNFEKYINYKKLMEYISFNCTIGNLKIE